MEAALGYSVRIKSHILSMDSPIVDDDDKLFLGAASLYVRLLSPPANL